MFILIKQNIYFLLKIINIESEHIHKSIINMLAEFPVYLNSHISLVNGHDRKKIVIVLHVWFPLDRGRHWLFSDIWIFEIEMDIVFLLSSYTTPYPYIHGYSTILFYWAKIIVKIAIFVETLDFHCYSIQTWMPTG